MLPFKAILVFIAVYISLTLAALLGNHLLLMHPQVTINIAVVVLSALAVNKFIKVQSKYSIDLLCITLVGGLCAVISITLLSFYYIDFEQPSMLESVVSFFFNALATYVTLYLVFRKSGNSGLRS